MHSKKELGVSLDISSATVGFESSILRVTDLIETVIVLVNVGRRALWDRGVSNFVAVFCVVNLDLVVVGAVVEGPR